MGFAVGKCIPCPLVKLLGISGDHFGHKLGQFATMPKVKLIGRSDKSSSLFLPVNVEHFVSVLSASPFVFKWLVGKDFNCQLAAVAFVSASLGHCVELADVVLGKDRIGQNRI